jgi:hypothetical protein
MSDEDPSPLSRGELERRIAEVQAELDHLMAERALTLRGTGVHIGGKRAQEMKDEFEQDEAQLRATISELRASLG